MDYYTIGDFVAVAVALVVGGAYVAFVINFPRIMNWLEGLRGSGA